MKKLIRLEKYCTEKDLALLEELIGCIREENSLIPDETLSAQMDTLYDKCQQIFRTVSESPSKAPQVRNFMNYYLPTTLKMLANYRTMQERGVSYGEMKEARETTIRGMNLQWLNSEPGYTDRTAPDFLKGRSRAIELQIGSWRGTNFRKKGKNGC